MGVRTSLLAITPTNTEIQDAQTAGQDVVGMLNFASQQAADAIATLTAIADFMPTGSNRTAVEAQITALT